jgi:hypothetical protein
VLILIIQNELLHHVNNSIKSFDLTTVFYLVIPPVYVPVSDRAVFDSTTSERMQIQPDSTVAMDCK